MLRWKIVIVYVGSAHLGMRRWLKDNILLIFFIIENHLGLGFKNKARIWVIRISLVIISADFFLAWAFLQDSKWIIEGAYWSLIVFVNGLEVNIAGVIKIICFSRSSKKHILKYYEIIVALIITNYINLKLNIFLSLLQAGHLGRKNTKDCL